MVRVVNSFALLGDEEGDDVTVLVEHFAKKVEVTAVAPSAPAAATQDKKKPASNQSKSQQGNGKALKFPPSESARSVRGRGREAQGHVPGRGGFSRDGAEHFGNERDNGYRRNYGEGSNGNGHEDAFRGRGRGRGASRGRVRGREFNNENVPRDENGMNNVEDGADGWEQVPQTHSRGYGNDVSNNRDEERPFRNANRNYVGETRSFRGGNHSYGYRPRKGMHYQRGEQLNNDAVKENVNGADDVSGVSNNAIAEGDAAAITEEPRDVGAEEKTLEEGVKVDNFAKKEEEEDEKLMTLEEYKKLYAEKRKALEALKIEERKVIADKDFEAMQLLEKKKEQEILLKPETAKLKKKDSLEKDEKSCKTVSINEFLKPADGEVFVYRRVGRGRGRGGRGDFRNGEHGFGSNGYPRGGRASDDPIIHIEDQGQFPVLKGAAPAAEAA